MQTPIDFVEEIISTQDWSYQRVGVEEIAVEIPGRWCDYRVHFLWQEEINILHISSYFDMRVQLQSIKEIYELMSLVNSKLALGHFEIEEKDVIPSYRYPFLFTNNKTIKTDYLENVLEIILSECERFYPAFQFVALGGKPAHEAVAVALLDTAGEA